MENEDEEREEERNRARKRKNKRRRKRMRKRKSNNRKRKRNIRGRNTGVVREKGHCKSRTASATGASASPRRGFPPGKGKRLYSFAESYY